MGTETKESEQEQQSNSTYDHASTRGKGSRVVYQKYDQISLIEQDRRPNDNEKDGEGLHPDWNQNTFETLDCVARTML